MLREWRLAGGGDNPGCTGTASDPGSVTAPFKAKGEAASQWMAVVAGVAGVTGQKNDVPGSLTTAANGWGGVIVSAINDDG